MSPRPDTLFELASRVREGASFLRELADFLDEFRSAPTEAAFVREPILLSQHVNTPGWQDVYLAAVAEHLCRQHGYRCPAWTRRPERYLDDPCFAYRSREGRLFLLKDSPAAFKSRNLFVTANALERA